MNDGFRLEFYRTRDGRQPALEYVRRQAKAHRAKIGRALQYLEEAGHGARRPLADYLRDRIHELRVPVAGHQHRLLYFLHGNEIVVVTVGFLKKEERVPDAEIERARRYRLDWLGRLGGEA